MTPGPGVLSQVRCTVIAPCPTSHESQAAVTSETQPLYVFIDESGNLDFKGKGTTHFVLSAYLTSDPLACSQGISALKYEFLRRGLESQLPFHATYNSQGTRKRVVDAMCDGRGHRCWVHSLVYDKQLVGDVQPAPEEFYAVIGGALATYLLEEAAGSYAPVVLVFDATLSRKQRGSFLKKVKPVLNRLGVEYHIIFAPVKEEPCGQLADYHAWALFRAVESGDGSWHEAMPRQDEPVDLAAWLAAQNEKGPEK